MREICINVVRASARVQRKEVRERVKTCIISSGSNYRQIRSEGFYHDAHLHRVNEHI